MTGDVCAERTDTGRCVLYLGHRGEHVGRARRPAGAPFKVCPRCGVAQPLAEQFQHRADGSAFSWCKGCNRAYSKERRARGAGS